MEISYKLPKEFTLKWLKALRSGYYNQSTGYLCNDVGYCCLGVACMLNGAKREDIFGVKYLTNKYIPDDIFFQSLDIYLANMKVNHSMK
jgi:hypothetical protein